MEELFNPTEEGRRIARTYLSRYGWARQRRIGLNRQINPGFQREEFEAKQKDCDQMEEDAEDFFSREVDHWRHEASPQAREVLRAILDMLGKRTDLGFFAKRIVARLKEELGPL